MKTYTICLTNLESRRAFVVGGGQVATRKVESLLEAGAPVTVISPEFTPELEGWIAAGQVTAARQTYSCGLLNALGARPLDIVIAAAGDEVANCQVWEEASALGCLVNAVDDPPHSNFILPAVLRRGEVSVAVSTGGASPALAARLRDRIAGVVEPDIAELAALLAALRPELIARVPPEGRRAAANRLLDADLLAALRRSGWEAALDYGRRLLQPDGEPDSLD